MIVVEHQDTCPPDRFADWLPEHRVLRPWRGDPVPERALEPVVVLGGAMHALADDRAPWLPAVRALLADAVARGVPALGVCLGAQLLSVAAGGGVSVGDPTGLELGVTRIRLTPAAAQDPLTAGLPDVLEGLSAHSDGCRPLPPDAVLLAASDAYPQIFRVGPAAWGVQYHPEVDTAGFERWAREDIAAHPDPSPERLERILAEARARREAMTGTSRHLAERFGALAEAWSRA